MKKLLMIPFALTLMAGGVSVAYAAQPDQVDEYQNIRDQQAANSPADDSQQADRQQPGYQQQGYQQADAAQYDRRGDDGYVHHRQLSNKDDEVTQKIRKALADDGALSPDARNVSIHAAKGKITFSGTVRDYNERNAVLVDARDFTAGYQVLDRLDMTVPALTER